MRNVTKVTALAVALLVGVPTVAYLGLFGGARATVPGPVAFAADLDVPILDLAVEANGALIIAGIGGPSAGGVSIRSQDGSVLHSEFGPGLGAVEHVAISRDGAYVAFADDRGNVTLRAGAAYASSAAYDVGSRPTALGMSDDGLWVVVGTARGELWLFRSPDFLVGGQPSGRFWGEPPANVPFQTGLPSALPEESSYRAITALDVSGRGNPISGSGVWIVAGTSLGEVWVLQASDLAAPGAAQFESRTAQGEPAPGAPFVQTLTRSVMPITAVAASPNANGFATRFLVAGDSNGTVFTWADNPLDPGRRLIAGGTIQVPGSAVRSIDLSGVQPRETEFPYAVAVAGFDDGTVRTWQTHDPTEFRSSHDLGSAVVEVAVSEGRHDVVLDDLSGRHITAVTAGGRVAEYGLYETSPVWTHDLADGSAGLAVALSDDGTVAAGGDGGALVFFRAPPTALLRFTPPDDLPPVFFQKGLATTFIDRSVSPDALVSDYAWSLSGPIPGEAYAASSFTKTFSARGSYDLTLRVTNFDGVTDLLPMTFSVTSALPVARLSANVTRVGPGGSVAFDATASFDLDGSIVAYNFDFGDGSTQPGTSPTATHTYPTKGVYAARVRVVDDDGALSLPSAPIEITVADAPIDVTRTAPFAPPITSVDLAHDSSSYAVGGGIGNRGGYLWEDHPGGALITRKVDTPGGLQMRRVNDLKVSAASERLAYGGSSSLIGTITAALAEDESAAGTPTVWQVDASADGRWIVSGDTAGNLLLFDALNFDEPVASFAMRGNVTGVSVNDTGELILAVDATGYFAAFDRDGFGSGPFDDLVLPQGFSFTALAAAGNEDGDGRHFAVLGDSQGYVRWLIILAGVAYDLGAVQVGTGPIDDLAFSDLAPGRKWLAYALNGRELKKFTDSSPQQGTAYLPVDNLTLPIPGLDLAASRNGRHLLVGTDRDVLYLDHTLEEVLWDFDTATGRLVTDADLSDDGTAIVADAAGFFYLFRAPPTADFRYGPVEGAGFNFSRRPTVDDITGFDASVSNPGGAPILHYQFDFGDGTVYNESAAGAPDGAFDGRTTHAYPVARKYDVSIRVVNEDGIRDIWTKRIDVFKSPPTARLAVTPLTVYTLQSVEFDASASTSPAGPIQTYSFIFGDGRDQQSPSPVTEHTFTEEGVYQASVQVFDVNGFYDISTPIPVTVLNRAPTARFTVLQPGGFQSLGQYDMRRAITFNGTTTSDMDGTIASWLWDFGDATGASGPKAFKTFYATGSYTVRLTATDDDGATHATSATIVVDDGAMVSVTLSQADDVYEDPLTPIAGSVVVTDTSAYPAPGTPKAGASVRVEVYYDGPRGVNATGPERVATLLATTGANGRADFTVPFTDDALNRPGRYHLFVHGEYFPSPFLGDKEFADRTRPFTVIA